MTSLKCLDCWQKTMLSLIRCSWIFNAQLYVHLKKWTLKFNLYYPLNHIIYFSEVCRICCANTHYSYIKSESLTQIRITNAEIQQFFYGIVFIGSPCRLSWKVGVIGQSSYHIKKILFQLSMRWRVTTRRVFHCCRVLCAETVGAVRSRVRDFLVELQIC